MFRNLSTPTLFAWSVTSAGLMAAPIQNLKFTDVVKDVKILNVATKAETPAKVGDVLTPPNVIKTGVDSRAELVAEDNTVTRVGANTMFSVEADSRDVNIAKGSVMFHSPSGRGGGRIKSAGATASVLGTTLIVGANQQGGFKVMLLEGKGQVTGASGGAVKLNAGQMSFAMPGQAVSQPLNFELKGQVAGSKLIGGFSKPVASIAKIEAAIATQQAQIAGGQLSNTGLLIGDSPSSAFKLDNAIVQNVIQLRREQIVKQVNPSRSVLDPRYAVALKNGPLNISSPAPTPESAAKFAEHAFTIDINTGRSSDGYAAPKTVKGGRDRQGDPYAGGIISVLFADEINISTPKPDSYLLVTPFEEKNYFGLVALKDINIQENLQLPHPVEADGYGKLLLLSAGRTLTLAPGKHLSSGANIDIFDIYLEGTEYSSDTNSPSKFLTPVEPADAAKVGLTLSSAPNNGNSSISSRSQRIENPTAGGVLRISAPSVQLDNVDLFSRTVGGIVEVVSREGDLQIGTDLLATLARDPNSSEATPDPTEDFPDPDEQRPNLLAAELSLRAHGSLKLLGASISTSGVTLESVTGKVEIIGAEFSGASLSATTAETDLSYVLGIKAQEEILLKNTFIAGAPILSLNSKSTKFENADFDVHDRLEVKFDLPMGFSSASEVATASEATSVKIRSTASTVRLSGGFAFSKEGSTPEDSTHAITLSNVTALDVSPGATEFPSDISMEILAQSSKVVVKQLGEESTPFTADLTVNALRNAALLEDVAIASTNHLEVTAEKDVTFQNVSVQTASITSRVVITSKNGSVLFDGAETKMPSRFRYLLEGKNVIQAKTVTVVARVVLDSQGIPKDSEFTGLASADKGGNIKVKNHAIKADRVYMSARNDLDVENVSFQKLNEIQNVNMSANTTILQNVTFEEGSKVNFKVGGDTNGKLVRANPGEAEIVRGLLNIRQSVKYGQTPIAFSSGGQHMDAAEFNTRLKAVSTSAAANITVGKR
jgi:hypothetical protein